MGLMKHALSEFEELYNIENGMKTPYLVSSHIQGLCLKCGNIMSTTNHGICIPCLYELSS